jgi:predicted permease
VLVVACANVASLQLARARARQIEIVTRLSLGASRVRVIRQLLTESTLLGLASGAAALLVTWLVLRALAALVSDAVPADVGTIVFNLTPDLSILAFVCAVSIAAGVIFGLTPALESTRASLVASDRSGTLPARGRRLQNALVGAQVAGTVVLLIAGSLLIRSAMQAVTADPGYDAARVIDAAFQFLEAQRYSADRKAAITRDLLTRISALPGVESVTSAQPPGFAFSTAIAPAEPQPAAAPHRSIEAYALVQAGYFRTVGIPLQFGHGFGADTTAAAHDVILSEAAARDLWPGQNPIGRLVRLGAIDEKPHATGELVPEGATYEVVDIAHDIRGVGLTPNDGRMIYLVRDGLSPTVPLLVRTTSAPDEVLRALPPAIAAVDQDVLVTTATLEDQLRQGGPFIISTLSAMVASTVGLIGLLLAVMGIHGTVSYIVARRTREIGIRMAIGAQRRDILTLVLRESARPVVVGLGVGIALAIGVSFVLRNVLYGVSRVDAVSFVGVSVLFLLIALTAAWPPARRAMRVEPVEALREA